MNWGIAMITGATFGFITSNPIFGVFMGYCFGIAFRQENMKAVK